MYKDLSENNGGKGIRARLNFILNHEIGHYLQIEKIYIKRKILILSLKTISFLAKEYIIQRFFWFFMDIFYDAWLHFVWKLMFIRY